MKDFLGKLNVTLSNKEVVLLLDKELKGLKSELLNEIKEYQKVDEDKIKLNQEIEKLKVKRGEIETLIAKGKEITDNTFLIRKEKVHDKDVIRLFFHQDSNRGEILFHNREDRTDWAFIPGGNFSVSAYNNGREIGLFERSNREWNTITTVEVIDRKVLSLRISPDGKTMVTAGDDSIITLWSLPELEIEAELKGHDGAVVCLALIPQGDILVSGEANRTSYLSDIIIWNFKKRKIIKRLKGHGGFITCLAASPDGKILVSGEALGNPENPQPSKIILWDIDNFRMMDILEGHAGWVESLIFTKEGMLISGDAVGGVNNPRNSDIIIWDVQKGIPLAKLQGQHGWVRSLALNKEETILASGGSNGIYMEWNFSKTKMHYL